MRATLLAGSVAQQSRDQTVDYLPLRPASHHLTWLPVNSERSGMEEQKTQPPVVFISQGLRGLRETIGRLPILYAAIVLIGSSLGTTLYFYPDTFLQMTPQNLAGIWTSAVFFICGGLAIGGARSKNKCLVVASLLMSVICAVSAGVLITISSLLLQRTSEMTTLSVLPIAMGVVMLGAGIASFVLSCRTLCCASKTRQTATQRTHDKKDLSSSSRPETVCRDINTNCLALPNLPSRFI